MLVFDSELFASADVLPMISGAEMDVSLIRGLHGPGGGNIRPPTIGDDGDDRQSAHLFRDTRGLFLEVLYLKISFLDAAARQAAANPEAAPLVNGGMRAEDILLSAAPSEMANAWAFQPKIITLWQDLTDRATMGVQPAPAFCGSLGSLWFETLLTNQQQTTSHVHAAVEKALADGIQDRMAAPSPEAVVWTEAFGPANNFWDPATFPHADPVCLAHWREALAIGFALMVNEPVHSDDHYRNQIRELKHRLRRRLFGGRAGVETSSAKEQPEELLSILNRLSRKWRETHAAVKPLSAPHTAAPRPHDPEPAPEPPETAIDLRETVIISNKKPEPMHPPSTQTAEPDLLETMLASTPTQQATPPSAKKRSGMENTPEKSIDIGNPEDRDLAETIVAPSAYGDDFPAPERDQATGAAPPAGPREIAPGEKFPELRQGTERPLAPLELKSPPADTDPAETVVLPGNAPPKAAGGGQPSPVEGITGTPQTRPSGGTEAPGGTERLAGTFRFGRDPRTDTLDLSGPESLIRKNKRFTVDETGDDTGRKKNKQSERNSE